MIVQVTPDHAAAMWGALAPLFERVTRHTNGCYEPADVLREILNGTQTLWVAWDEKRNALDAAMTTSLATYPRRKACRVLYISGGNMKAWLGEFIETVERYARDNGATLLEGFFRPGWARVWPGSRTCGVNLVKDLAA